MQIQLKRKIQFVCVVSSYDAFFFIIIIFDTEFLPCSRKDFSSPQLLHIIKSVYMPIYSLGVGIGQRSSRSGGKEEEI